MSTKQFRNIVMIIIIIALAEVVVGLFYYFVFFVPKRQMEEIGRQEQTALEIKRSEDERILEETRLKEQTRMEEIRLEVSEIDLELSRIKRWENEGEAFEKLRREEEESKGREASLEACMKIVVENYHKQWNLFCEQLKLPNSCSMPDEYSKQINSDYETGKKQCENFFEFEK